MQRFVFHSIHKVDNEGHGGNRRLAQIVEVLKQDAPNLEMRHDIFGGGTLANVRSIVSGMTWTELPLMARIGHLKAVRNAGIVRSLCRGLDADAETVGVFDSYLGGYVQLLRHIKMRGGKVILFPQNLDSLTAGTIDPMSGRAAPDWMEDEIAIIGGADLVCCISREEQWLLSVFGIQSLFLPYYPTQQNRAALDRIRVQRKDAGVANKVLIFGSVLNTPTLRGVESLIENARGIVDASGGREVIVVGFGTEALRRADLPRKFRILGGVSRDAMDRCLLESAVCLCFQPGTGGALTRIPELLCAGVPVIANYVAARSYQNVAGVRVVETMEHLLDALRNFDQIEFDPPEPPTGLEKELRRGLFSL